MATTTSSFLINKPSDFHHHLRDGEQAQSLLRILDFKFDYVLAMPNLSPPLFTVEDVLKYRARLDSRLVEDALVSRCRILFTLYLTEETKEEDVHAAAAARGEEGGGRLIVGYKYYPRGATTNSEYGVRSFSRIKAGVLRALEEENMVLLIHGETTDEATDFCLREKAFIDTELAPLVQAHPSLKIVFEHISTKAAVDFVLSCSQRVGATITPHHLRYTRLDLERRRSGGNVSSCGCANSSASSSPDGDARDTSMTTSNSTGTAAGEGADVDPFLYCYPILKDETDRQSLMWAATSGNEKFFFGSDSAPHSIALKTSKTSSSHSSSSSSSSTKGLPPAGIYNAPVSIELLATVFEERNALDMLEGFASDFGPAFYNLPVLVLPPVHDVLPVPSSRSAEVEAEVEVEVQVVERSKIRLVKESWLVPMSHPFGGSSSSSSSDTGDGKDFVVRSLCAGLDMGWRVCGV